MAAGRRRDGWKVAAMALTSIDLVLSLDEVGSADAPRVGRKAATLGELKRAGFPVPEGVVVTTEALVRALAAAGLDAGAGPDQVEAVPLPGEVAAAVATAAARLGGGPLAVRSSGVDEDLPGASYAGQYESVLGVPAGDLAAAVRRCWASAFTRHVAAYRQSRGVGRDVAMAVLVQPMVAAEAAWPRAARCCATPTSARSTTRNWTPTSLGRWRCWRRASTSTSCSTVRSCRSSLSSPSPAGSCSAGPTRRPA